ncbi:hypothetical protein PPROV_000103500 [Pycnococcus provasolii]|uniref:Uncharacterized protein n=2 Tax=Pycnococcus provasolii TaxID=41880 RepID=A0A830H6M5_9CHLO|nr:hypothetical protein PPROV_000103500 [Pycnococcus provasolii]
MPGGGAESMLEVDPLDVLFSYGKINSVFSGTTPPRTLTSTLADILSKKLAPEQLPAIAVIPLPAEYTASRAKSGENDDDDDGDDGEKRRGSKRKQKKEKHKQNDVVAQKYASLNNRRLWVLRECRSQGVLTTIKVRVKPPDECARLLAKGSRTFRLDRVTDRATVLVGNHLKGEGEGGAL